MPSNDRKHTIASELTFARVVELGGLDLVSPVPEALQALPDARHLQGDAESAHGEALREAQNGRDPRRRREAQRALEDLRAARLDARATVEQAARDVSAARHEAFERVAPVVRAAHVHIIETRLEPALRELEIVCNALTHIESIAGHFTITAGGSTMPSTSPIGGEVGSQVLVRVHQFLDLLAWHRRPSAAA